MTRRPSLPDGAIGIDREWRFSVRYLFAGGTWPCSVTALSRPLSCRTVPLGVSAPTTITWPWCAGRWSASSTRLRWHWLGRHGKGGGGRIFVGLGGKTRTQWWLRCGRSWWQRTAWVSAITFASFPPLAWRRLARTRRAATRGLKP